MAVEDGSTRVTPPEGEHTGVHRFRWRRAIALNPLTNQSYRIAVGVLGLLVVVAGLIMVPFPGPGWLVVFVGVAIWGSEFDWAANLLTWGRKKLSEWNDWLGRQALWVKGGVGLGTFACVVGALWVVLIVSGVPGFLPETAQEWLQTLPAVD